MEGDEYVVVSPDCDLFVEELSVLNQGLLQMNVSGVVGFLKVGWERWPRLCKP